MRQGVAAWIVLCLTSRAAGLTFSQEAVAAHNNARSHEAASGHAANLYELVWDASLAKQAQTWANGCVYEHRNLDNHGENIYYSAPRTHPDNYYVDRAVSKWMLEKTYNKNGNFDCCYSGHYDCCHYSQIVAARSRRVGCGIGHCADLKKGGHVVTHNAAYVVCFYEPRGNLAINGKHMAYTKGTPCSQCDHGDSCHNNLCRAK